MRVLFTVNPEKSLFPYLVPLAWALRTAGHEVRVASQPHFAGTITQAGLTAVPVGRDRTHDRRLVAGGWTPEALEENRSGLGTPYDIVEDPGGATWDRVLADHQEAVRVWHNPENFPLVAELVDFTRYWRPDLVVWEPLTFAGAIAAKASGAAHARMLWSLDVFGLTREHFRRLRDEQPPGERADPLAGWLGAYGRKYGFEFTEDMVTGDFTVDPLPPSLALEADLIYLRMRYEPYGGPATVPRWLRIPPERPRVAVSLGLSATRVYGGYHLPLQDILERLAELDIEVVATIAASEQAKLGRLPANVRLVSYAPLHALVPTCAAVVHHAGAATLATTALYDVPHLALHHHWDGPLLARRLAAHGSGLEIHTDHVTGDAVRDAVARLLSEPSFPARAVSLGAEMRSLPTGNEVASRLPELAAVHRPGI